MKILPSSRPQLTQAGAQEIITNLPATLPGVSLADYSIILLGIRGYYLSSMGNPKSNDRGIYDDALFLLTPTSFQTFNANTDPSIRRDKVAVLEPNQVVEYRVGMHRQGTPGGHMALRQSSPVIVRRDNYIQPAGRVDSSWGISLGGGLWTDRNWAGGIFAINIHKGGNTTTSSLGCQTIPPVQWANFFTSITGEIARHKVKSIAYVLTQDSRLA